MHLAVSLKHPCKTKAAELMLTPEKMGHLLLLSPFITLTTPQLEQNLHTCTYRLQYFLTCKCLHIVKYFTNDMISRVWQKLLPSKCFRKVFSVEEKFYLNFQSFKAANITSTQTVKSIKFAEV